MSKKSETIKIGLLTALIAFAAIAAFVVVMSPTGGITSPAHAFRNVQTGDYPYGGHGGFYDSNGVGGGIFACNIHCY